MVATETGWLVELRDTTHNVRYLALRHEVPVFWTSDANLAMRFARKQDAEDYIVFWDEDGKSRAVEHAWVEPRASSSGADPLENGYDPANVERIYRDRLKEVLAENEQLRAALEPFAAVAEHDIGASEDDCDSFRQSGHSRARLLTVGDFRRALALPRKRENFAGAAIEVSGKSGESA